LIGKLHSEAAFDAAFSRNPARPLRDRVGSRRWRNGRGVPRARHAARPAVAIKALPEHLSSNPQLRERFEREAKAISSLSHPHICALFDVGQQDGVDYLVMEYLEGETLAHRLKKGPLPPEQTSQYAIQIADALDTAHKHAVIHRDLKPGNIMLTKAGAKLLDFGLAKVRAAEAVAGMTAVPTQTTPLTGEGTILGTVQYMAPEQLEGKEADARTDIFALGAVIYEMATGRKAFEGKSQASLISAIMTSEPAFISILQSMAAPTLDHVVRICLAKEPDARWQNAHDVLVELNWISQADVEARISLTPHRVWIGWATAALLVLVLLVTLYMRPHPPESRNVTLSILPPDNTAFGQFAISPDGDRLAFTASQGGKRLLWVRPLDALVAKPLLDTEGPRSLSGHRTVACLASLRPASSRKSTSRADTRKLWQTLAVAEVARGIVTARSCLHRTLPAIYIACRQAVELRPLPNLTHCAGRTRIVFRVSCQMAGISCTTRAADNGRTRAFTPERWVRETVGTL
jgi:serine/threonine protein kinase